MKYNFPESSFLDLFMLKKIINILVILMEYVLCRHNIFSNSSKFNWIYKTGNDDPYKQKKIRLDYMECNYLVQVFNIYHLNNFKFIRTVTIPFFFLI